jgi:hypothetical protein
MNYKEAISPRLMCRELQKQNLTQKKTYAVASLPRERVQIYMCEYWEKVKTLDHGNLVFLDKMGFLLGEESPMHVQYVVV